MKNIVAWVLAHRKQIKADLVVVGAALAAQPAVHAWLGGEHVAAATLITAAVAAAGVAARTLIK